MRQFDGEDWEFVIRRTVIKNRPTRFKPSRFKPGRFLTKKNQQLQTKK